MFVVSFGSKQRGDFDVLSDTDILIIDNDINQLLEGKMEYARHGCAVTAMPLNKAKYLIENGSLFFKHIIDEGMLVKGEYCKYHTLLQGWEKATSYEKGIEENLDLLELLCYLPRTHWGLLFAVDLLAISIRNILIRKFVEFGLFVFSWKDISRYALKYGLFDIDDITIFLHAREVKNYYRDGHALYVSFYFVQRLSKILKKITEKGIGINFSSKKEIFSLYEKFPDGSYRQLRAIEILCAFYNFKSIPLDFFRWIRDPNYFSLTKGRETNMLTYSY